MHKQSFSHAFGAVLGPGTTEFRGAFSYAVLVIERIDNPECFLGTEPMGLSELILSNVPLPIVVASGRLLVMVFAFNK
ncbi:hypothetical protein T440DRAFT_426473 [Plenodomus tracheiphilus IPT5]|uniref:Uncharacterized protein n=1 Tax=Plenodomus tracheiphilus IPT5 TaxID=1408161 RepID=A0A6A7B1P0_9PLEO|nr:hypothetical protein T440DRAFT_426473 [Plenodomus tracheiphilus IPT5]